MSKSLGFMLLFIAVASLVLVLLPTIEIAISVYR